MSEKLLCEVCKKNEAVGVCCVPGVPMSCAYCRECLDANAHPVQVLAGVAWQCDGLTNTVPEFQEMVACTLRHLGVAQQRFDEMVTQIDIDAKAYCDAADNPPEVKE